MKKVLMIAHSFPPAGGPGVQRTSKFVKHLRSFQWEPVILTRDDKNLPLTDESLLKDIPPGISVYRTRACDLNRVLGVAGKIVSRTLLIPDGERLWQLFSLKKALEIIENEKIDLIYTTSLPYTSHLLGLEIKKRHVKLPWVADFRDEWTNNPYILDNPYNPLRMKIERAQERRVLESADMLITNTPVMLRNFLNNNNHLNLNGKFHVIPNGYDPDDFNMITPSKKDHGRYVISYTGSFYGRRKPDPFLRAMGELISEGSIDADDILLRLMGNFKHEQIGQLSKKYNLEDCVEILPYMPHDQCIKAMMESDCLLLIEGSGPGSDAFYTGKIFEYMMSTRPILAVIPSGGAAAELIRDTATGLVCDYDSPGQIKKGLESFLSGEYEYNPNKKEIAKYDRRNLTFLLAQVFKKAGTF